MPTITDIRNQYPDLGSLDDNQVVDALHQAFYADLPREQVAASLGIKAPPVPAKPRTWGEAAKDTGAALLQGGAGLVKSAGDLYGVAAGDMNNPVSELGQSAQEYWQDAKSDPLKKKMAERDANIRAQDGIAGKAWTAFKDTVTDPALAMDTVAGNAATMIPGAAVGRGIAAGITARSLAAGPITEAVAGAAAKAAGKWGTAGAIAAGGVQQGADVSSNVYDMAMKKPDSVWDTNPDFVARVQALGGNTPENRQAAKNELATTAARMTFPAATAISLAANAIPGADMLERALVGGAATQTIKAGTKYALPKAIGKAALGEAGQEFIEEGGGQLAGNVASRSYVDPNQDLTEQVGENAGMGAAGGFLLGAGGGVFHQPQHVEEKGPLSRGANAGIDAAGPVPVAPAPVPLTPEATATLLAHANARAQALTDKANGTKDQKTTAPDGKPVTVPGQAKQFLTPAETEEQAFLAQNGGDAQALVKGYPGLLAQPPVEELPAQDPIAQTQQAIDASVSQAAQDKARQRSTQVDSDPMQAEANDIVSQTGKVSISLVQRTLKIGYNRAAKMVENMEFDGLVSPAGPDGIRQVLKAGKATPPASAADLPKPTAAAFDQREEDRPIVPLGGVRDSDIKNGYGQPFKNMQAAMTAQKRAGDTHEIVRVVGGLVVRPKETNGTTDETAGLDQAPDAGAGNQPTGSRADPLAQPVSGTDGQGSLPATADGRSKPDNAVVDAGKGAPAVAPTGNSSIQDLDAVKAKHDAAQVSDYETIPVSANKHGITQNEIKVAQLPNGKWVSSNSWQDGDAGGGGPVRNDAQHHDSRDEAINAAIDKALSDVKSDAMRAKWEAARPAKGADDQIQNEQGAWEDPKKVYTDMLASGWKAMQPKGDRNLELHKAGESPVAVRNSHADMVRTLANADLENEQWTRMPQAERLALTTRTGMAKMIADKIARTPWAEITAKTRARIEAAMAAPAAEQVAPAAEDKPATPISNVIQAAKDSGKLSVVHVGDKPAASANTIFTEDAAEKARAVLKKKLNGTLNSGIDPELLQAGITLAGYHIEKGARSFAAYAKAMLADLGDSVKPYLKSWYMAVKFDPRASDFSKEMTSSTHVELFDMESVKPDAAPEAKADPVLPASAAPTLVEHVTGKNKTLRGVVRTDLSAEQAKAIDKFTFKKDGGQFIREQHLDALNAAHPAEAPAAEPAPQAKADDAAADAVLADVLDKAIRDGDMPKDNPALKKIVEALDMKPATQQRMKQAQEVLETAIVRAARSVVAKNEGQQSTFDALVRLYASQPNLNIRTSTSIENQAYSTPAPLAFVASELTGITAKTTVLEPTAGNGMLLIGAKIGNTRTNELNDDRVASLKSQGFNPTQKDATQGFSGVDGAFDSVITNPPFGPIKDAQGNSIKVKVDGYTIGQIDHLIAARALQTMKDDGRATLIIGANKVTGEQSNNDLIFFNWLHGNYNVTSHFEVDGDLYQRQGAAWPVRVITISGRIKSSTTAPAPGTIQRATTWSEVYEQFQHSLGAQRATDTTGASPVSAQSGPKGNDAGSVSVPAGSKTGPAGDIGPGGSTAGNGNVSGTGAGTVLNSPTVTEGTMGSNDRAKRQPDATAGKSDKQGDTGAGKSADAAPNSRTPVSADAENQFQAKYVPRSARKDEGVLIPVNMAGPTQDALNRLEDEVGDIDEYARSELGYKSVKELHAAFMGLQVDSVASAINQIKKEKGVIIADQTGIGKGRQAAAIIRWAAKNGKTPVFVTVKPSLFTDMYGDLHDIGTDDVTPFILNKDESIKGREDEKLFANKASSHTVTMTKIANTGALPAGSNALFMTYSQINKDNIQRKAVLALAPNAVFVLDESHNAGGDSGTGGFIRDALGLASGVTYLSATYAKRPGNMPVYFKTDIGDAVADDETLMSAMAQGGLPLQTVVANNLVKAGQMFRRERSYDGVSIESRADSEHRAEHVKMSDTTTLALRAIVHADKTFHHAFVKAMQKELASEGAKVLDMAGNQAQASVDHTQFSSVVHNFVRQMLLGLKAQEAANDAIRSLKRGEKPLIAVENTMGSFLNEYAENNALHVGDQLGNFTYRTVLSRALERSRYIVRQLPNGDKVKEYIPMSKLDPLSYAAYTAAQEVIDGLKIDIPVSPIDWMRQEIMNAGFTVAEVTGRNLSVDYSDPKNPKLSQIDQREQKDKVRTTRQFNSGELDSIILNVAGSTGISLHASEKFKDQRQRHMIVAQAAQDINIFMQMLGRVHRTGQVALPKYTILNADLPAEIRPTALLSGKMKSLNANTSSNTESATSVKSSDMLNKYGDKIVGQYLIDNPELADALGLETPAENGDGSEDIARKATGRLALMPVKVQEQFYAEVEEQYTALIDYLNKTNQNELEPKTFDFDAQETKSEVLFVGQNKASPFGEDAIYGEYSVKAQGKAMTPAEIKAAMAEHLDGRTPVQHNTDLHQKLSSDFITFNAHLPEAQQAGAAVIRSKGSQFLVDHPIGAMFRVDINDDKYNAIITNIRSTHKATGNPFSLSKFQVTISVNGALRSVTVPATQFNQIETSGISGYGASIEREFKVGPPNERETAKIVTGNLLGAYGEMDSTRGSIITFTKADGSTEQGILLPKAFNFAKDVRQDYRLKTPADVFNFVTKSNNENIARFGINSRDGVVRVMPDGSNAITIQVPKSKAKGGKFFLDKNLLAATGDFTSQGNYMRATVEGRKASIAALEVLMQKQALYALPSMAEEARDILGETGTAFSRASDTIKAGGQPAARAQATVNQITSRWVNAPTVIVVQNLDDPRVPEAIRKDANALQAKVAAQAKSTGKAGDPDGFIDKDTGTVFLIADKLAGDADVVRVLMHESLGHFGLRGLYGPELGTILDRMAVLNADKVRHAAKRLDLDFDNADQRRIAAEEVLAYMAQTIPDLGWVRKTVAAVRSWLRKHIPGFGKMHMTDAELIQNYIIPARQWVEDGGPKGGGSGNSSTRKTDATGNSSTSTAFSQSKTNAEVTALEKLSQSDELFALPKSQATTMQEIAADNNPKIKVRQTKMMSETLYTLTMPNDQDVKIWVRPPNPYGEHIYSMALRDGEMADATIGRPGENPEDVDPAKEDVYIDVSTFQEGGYGTTAYNIAATFAHNTGRIFIGDPSGLTDAAMRRRTENMLSSALKFGTTDHLAPHPYQVNGDASIGVPPLKWVYGDTLGNINRMIDVSIKSMDNAFPNAKNLSYDLDAGTFKNSISGRPVPFGELAGRVGNTLARARNVVGSQAEAGRVGWRTLARNSLFRAIQQAANKDGSGADGGGLLDRLRAHAAGMQRDGVSGIAYAPESRIFYSRNLGEALTSGINSVRDVKLAAGYQVGDLFQGAGRLHWWHKSVGTMYHLAQKSPPFKRVYDSIQNFLNDVSFYAAESADLAPKILPKLDKISDIWKSPLSPADTKALSAPVFEGTLTWGRDKNGKAAPMEEIEAALEELPLDERAHMLMKEKRVSPDVVKMWQGLPQDQYEAIINGKFEREFMKPGVVFTPAELKQHFSMTDDQVALYQEFRKATDKSIDNLAISEMLNYAGKDAIPLRDEALAATSVEDAAQLLRDYLVSLTEIEPERDAALSATAAKMLDIGAHANDMKGRGYAPLSRFGTYTLEATLPTGERYFSLFETDRERNKMARLLIGEKATDLKTGTMSQEAYKLLNGVSPETAALFGEMLGLDSQGSEAKDLAFQEFIKRGTANRSAMKRLLKRKGIAGFSEDSGRVLAGFIYSNARKTASNLHAKETASAVNDIPKEQGELKDEAVKLSEYVSNPTEEAQAFRGILFAQYLGGSVASAMVNATQPFAVTLPYLSQFGGVRKAGAQMLAAVRDAGKDKTGDTALDASLKKAEEEGIVSPQEVHALQAQAMGKAQLQSGDGTTAGNALATANNYLSKLYLAWGKVFGLAEQFNRRTTFIAAYRTAVEQSMGNPAAFAEKAVSETQFVYNKGNKPRWARGAVGSVLFTFKQYSVNYLELVTRMATAGEPGSAERKAGQKAAVLAIAILFLMSGADGLPFMEDIEDVIDGAMQRLGYNFSSKQQMKTFLSMQLGKDGAEFLMSGVSGLPGAPIDVSGRLGMGNLIPGTGLFQKKTDHTRDLMELAGPGGDLVKRAFASTEQALGGNIGGAISTIAPTAARNVVKAIDMGDTGMYRDDRGRKIIDTTPGEAIFKGIGFQPRSVKDVQEASMEVQKAKSQYIVASSEIRAKMAQAIFMDDAAMKQSARDALASWNEKNPDQYMSLNMPAVLRQVREMRKSKEQRMADTAPKAVRSQVREQLKEELH